MMGVRETKKQLLLIIFLLISSTAFSQDFEDWEEYDIDDFYKKVDLEYGTLDEDGDEIDYVFVTTEMEKGLYEVEISDEVGDLYLIENTDYYIEFDTYYGYASYDEGVLEVNSYGGGTFYKKEF